MTTTTNPQWLTTYVCAQDRYIAVLETGKYDCPICGASLEGYPPGDPIVSDLLTTWIHSGKTWIHSGKGARMESEGAADGGGREDPPVLSTRAQAQRIAELEAELDRMRRLHFEEDSPTWKARAVKAEAEVARLKAELADLKERWRLADGSVDSGLNWLRAHGPGWLQDAYAVVKARAEKAEAEVERLKRLAKDRGIPEWEVEGGGHESGGEVRIPGVAGQSTEDRIPPAAANPAAFYCSLCKVWFNEYAEVLNHPAHAARKEAQP